jgi:ferrous iron transport protein A
MTSLAQLAPRSRGVVVALPGARGLAQRLISLGLTPGAEFEVLQNRGHGPLIIQVHGARVALGRGQAVRVIVGPLPEQSTAKREHEGGQPADAPREER